MSPGAHLLFSWLSGVEFLKKRRERVLVTLSGMAPDLDGLGIIIDRITDTTNYYIQYHHFLGHSIFSAICLSTLASMLAKEQKLRVWVLALLVVHIHIVCDIVGSKGSDGHQWPIYYLYPVAPAFGLTWEHQWELNAWQNLVIIGTLFCISGYYAATKQITFLEVFSRRLDKEAIVMYRKYIEKNT